MVFLKKLRSLVDHEFFIHPPTHVLETDLLGNCFGHPIATDGLWLRRNPASSRCRTWHQGWQNRKCKQFSLETSVIQMILTLNKSLIILIILESVAPYVCLGKSTKKQRRSECSEFGCKEILLDFLIDFKQLFGYFFGLRLFLVPFRSTMIFFNNWKHRVSSRFVRRGHESTVTALQKEGRYWDFSE